MHVSKKAFIDQVCQEISFKEAHKAIREELELHIDDLVENFLEEGLSEKEALIMAVQSMGKPKEIGEELNKVHNSGIQWQVITAAGGLSLIGIISLLLLGELPYGNGIIFGIRQLISIAIGGLAMVLMYHVNYRKLIENSKQVYFLGVSLSLVTILFGNTINGHTFLQVGPISFEVAKLSNLIFLISIIGILGDVKNRNSFGLVKVSLYIVFALFCLYINSNTQIVPIMLVVYLSIITIAILNNYFSIRKKLINLIVIHGFAVFCMVMWKLNITKIGNSPANWVDYELAIIVSKFGWEFVIISSIVVIILIASMILSALKMKSNAAYYFSIAIVIYFICSFITASIINFGFLYGISSNIPFISFGATNYITDCVLIGIFLSMWRRNLIVERDKNV